MTVFMPRGSSNSLTAPTSQHILSRLPLELREQVYHYAFLPFASSKYPNHTTITAADTVHGGNTLYPSYLPSACRINEATRVDVGLWFIRNTEFTILYPQHLVYLSQVLSTFPYNQGFAAIRRLDFQLFGRHKVLPGHSNAYIEFMKRCPELTEVRIKFEVWHLLKHVSGRWMPDDVEMVLLEGIAATFGMEGLFDMKSLATLTIEVWPRAVARRSSGVQVVVPDCWVDMERLVEWLRTGFVERGRKVVIRLVESGNSGLRWDGTAQILGMGV